MPLCQGSYLQISSPDDTIHGREFTSGNYLGLDHRGRSGKARSVDTGCSGPGTMGDISDPVQLFTEEIPQKGLEAGGHEIPNHLPPTRGTTRTLGIPLESVSLRVI